MKLGWAWIRFDLPTGHCIIIASLSLTERERAILIEFLSLFQCNFWEKGVSLPLDSSTL